MVVANKLGADDDVIGAGGVIDAERRAAAIHCTEIGKVVVNAFSFRRRAPTFGSQLFGMGHKHTVMTTVTDGDVEELIFTARAHEDSQIVREQNCIAYDIGIKSQIERNTRAGIVVQIEIGKKRILGLVTGQAIKFVVE